MIPHRALPALPWASLALLLLAVQMGECSRPGPGASLESSTLLGRVGEFEMDLIVSAKTSQSLAQVVSRIGGTQRLVIFTVASSEYIELVLNWMHSVEALGYKDHALVLAEDDDAFSALSASWPDNVISSRGSNTNTSAGERGTEAEASSLFFHSVLGRRPSYLLALLELNVSVFLNDADTVWIKDPVPLLNSTKHKFDVLLQEDVTTLNSSLKRFPGSKPGLPQLPSKGVLNHVSDSMLFVNPTPGGLEFVRQWRANIMEMSRWQRRHADPQEQLNNVMNQLRASKLANVGILPVYRFPPGCFYFGYYPGANKWGSSPCEAERLVYADMLTNGTADPLVVHSPRGASLLEKQSLFQQKGLWRVPGILTTLDEVVSKFVGPDRLVIFSTVDKAFLDFAVNWHASLSRFGYGGKVLFIAEDKEAYDFCIKQWPNQTVFFEENKLDSDMKGHAFGGQYYFSLIQRRPKYLQALLQLNYTVLFNDIDMVWMRDPKEWLDADYDVLLQEDSRTIDKMEEKYPNAEIRFINGSESVCGCFLRVRPTAPALEFVKRWLEEIENTRRVAKGRAVNDQPALNSIVRRGGGGATVAMVPMQHFPSGCVYFGVYCKEGVKNREEYKKLQEQGKADPVIVHANWMKGRAMKKGAFKSRKLWFVPKDLELRLLGK